MSAPAQITILIPDPDEMMFVTGTNDANIDRIEREFDVKIVSRGAELRISGDPSQVARVGELVGAMRTISERDDPLRKPALERLIGDAKDAPLGPPEQMRDLVGTTVRGKRITPQSPNQRAYVEAIESDKAARLVEPFSQVRDAFFIRELEKIMIRGFQNRCCAGKC